MSVDKQHGFSLIEMVIFIVVIGILMSGMLVAVNRSLSLAVLPNRAAQATFLANARMEIILLSRAVNGWTAFTDPCPAAPICTPLATFASTYGFTVTPNITTSGVNKTIDVSVSGTAAARAVTVVSQYE